MTQQLSELWKYRRNIFRLDLHNHKTNNLYRSKECIGTFVKPLARMIGKLMKMFGYSVRYRGRGQRSGKYTNCNGDIRMKDSLFLSVYCSKKV